MTRTHFKDSRRPYFWCEKAVLHRRLKPIEISVYCVLASRVNDKEQCWPSYARVAEDLGVSRRTAMRAVETLADKGLLRKIHSYDKGQRKSSNLYELVDLPVESIERSGLGLGDTGDTIHGDMDGTPMVSPVSPAWCHQSPCNEESLKEEAENEEQASTPPDSDPALAAFEEGFQRRYGYQPRISEKQRRRWRELRSSVPQVILLAKIDAWWDYQCKRLDGNRTVGAFLQWFDDIPIPVTTRHVSVIDFARQREEMLRGSEVGKQLYTSVVNGISDCEAKVRTLRVYKYARDEEEARRVIVACESPLP